MKKWISSVIVFRSAILFFPPLLQSLELFSQQNPFPFQQIEFITSGQGFNGREVYWMRQDRHGFLWIIADNGLNRYDGYTFRSWSYNASDSNALVPGAYYSLAEDTSGVLWIPSEVKGFYSFDPNREKFVHYRHQPGISNSLIDDETWTLAAETNGTIWIGTEKGLDKYEPQTKTFTHFVHHAGDPSSISDDEVFAIVLDNKNTVSGEHANLWLMSRKSPGIDCFNTKTGKVMKHFDFPFPKSDYRWGGNPLLNIDGLKNNVFWIGSNDKGIYGFNTLTEQFVYIKIEHRCNALRHALGFYAVLEDHSGNLWTMNDNNELVYYDRVNQKFYFYNADRDNVDFLNFNSIIFEDENNKILIGTSNGLLTIDTKQKSFFADQWAKRIVFSISENSIADIHRLQQEQLLEHAGINNTGEKKIKIVSPFPLAKYGEQWVRTIYKDSKGALWLTGSFGVISYNPVTKKIRTYQLSDNSDPVIVESFSGIVEDLKGRLWAVNSTDGLYKIDTVTGTLGKFTVKREINFNSITGFDFIFRDSRGILYLSAWEAGFVTFNPDNETFSVYHHDANDPTSVSSETATVFCEAKNGLIWFGTISAGVNVFNPVTRKFRAFTVNDGLPQNFITSLTEDKNGNYWVGTRGGISCFTPPMDPFAPECRIRFRNYDESDGLSSNYCSYRSAFCDLDGTLYFGTRRGGIFYFHPDVLKDNDFIPPVYITDFRLMNKPVNVNDSNSVLKLPIEFTKELSLNYRQNIITFTFAALNYSHPEKNKYAYMLDGFDKDWIYTDASKRFANYTNLDPDEYVFKVKASNNDGVWNENPTELKIIITPPFWKTWWFRILLVAILAIAMYGVYRYRLQQVINLQTIRNKIASDLHDDIGSTLNSISIFSQVAEQDPAEQKHALQMIGESSRKIIESMSDIVWTINPENDSFSKIIFRMRSFAFNLLRAKNIEFTFRAEESLNDKKLSMEARRNFYLIFKEALNNIVKYAEATFVTIDLKETNTSLALFISDNGKGFDSAHIPPGNGLNNMRRRAKEMDADLTIQSVMNEGTSVELFLRA